jgi:ubiquinone/menaquinone biosynthesis C-methylase UbiE
MARTSRGEQRNYNRRGCSKRRPERALSRDALPATTQLTCTDLQASMLEVARRKFRGRDERVDFHPADATALPFGDAGFDLVVCQFGVMF